MLWYSHLLHSRWLRLHQKKPAIEKVTSRLHKSKNPKRVSPKENFLRPPEMDRSPVSIPVDIISPQPQTVVYLDNSWSFIIPLPKTSTYNHETTALSLGHKVSYCAQEPKKFINGTSPWPIQTPKTPVANDEPVITPWTSKILLPNGTMPVLSTKRLRYCGPFSISSPGKSCHPAASTFCL